LESAKKGGYLLGLAVEKNIKLGLQEKHKNLWNIFLWLRTGSGDALFCVG
jgi:hypothetical protein